MIIDNEEDLINSIAELLELNNFQVTCCLNGPAGIKNILLDKPDLIICDLMMPGMDGYAVLEAVREMDLCKNIPFLFLTGISDEETRRKGMIKGADDFISKPFKYDHLLQSIDSILAKHAKRRGEIVSLSSKIKVQLKSFDEINFLTNHKVRTNISKIIQTLELMKTDQIDQTKGMLILIESAFQIDEITSDINDLLSQEEGYINNKSKISLDSSARIVLIDDDPIQIMLNELIIKKKLSVSEIFTFTHGKNALKFIEKNKVDVIFLDLNMPGMSGFDVLNSIDLMNSKVSVIMLSSSLDPKQINECYAYSNVSDYIVKPLNDKSLEKLMVE